MKRRQFLMTGLLGIPGLLRAIGSPALSGEIGPTALFQEFMYYLWSWDNWRAITGAKPRSYVSDQVGKHELVDLLALRGHRITTPAEWAEKREEIRHILLEVLGDFPPLTTLLNPRIVEEKHFEKYIRRKVIYTSEPGDDVPAYLFLPLDGLARHPAVLCAHQTNPYGKQEAAGIDGDPSMALAPKLAERGYVTLAPDAICFGERHDPLLGHYGDAIAFYRKHREWSIAGKMVWDKSRAIDYLWTLDEVDPQRIGAIGHSHGAYGSLQAAAFDSRMRAVVASCGFTPFRTDGNTYRWSHATALMPRLGFYLGGRHMTLENFTQFKLKEVDRVPFDWHHILALIAPRPLYLSVALDDEVFPGGETIQSQVLPRVQPVYELLSHRERIEARFFKGGHRFPEESQQQAFAWLDRWLKGNID
jgi:dienelactone hydrolase